jgi:RimJ/RimL family protein N-acetyltransferase
VAKIGPTLQTDRLTLRPPTPEDFEAWANWSSDPQAMLHLGGVQPRPVAWRGFLSTVGGWVVQGCGMFSVFERQSGAWIGRVGAHHPLGWPGKEVGWGLVTTVWGKGYATEAASACMDFVVDTLGWTEIIHCIDAANLPSQRVALRLGSERLGPARLPPPIDRDIEVWGQSAQAWRQRRRAAT